MGPCGRATRGRAPSGGRRRPRPRPAPGLWAAHARRAALRGRRERGRSAAARRSAPHSCWASAAPPRSGARARRRPRPGRPARLRRPRGGAGGGGGGAGGWARRWPAAGRAPGRRVSRGATFPAARDGGRGPDRAGIPGRAASGWARGGLRRRPSREAAGRGCARGLRRACPRPACPCGSGPGVRVCPGAAAAPTRRDRTPVRRGWDRGPGLSAAASPAPRPGPPSPAADPGRRGAGAAPPQRLGIKFAAAPRGGPCGAQARPGRWTSAWTSVRGRGRDGQAWVGIGAARQGRGGRRRSCGLSPRPALGRGVEVGATSRDHRCHRPLWPGVRGSGLWVPPGRPPRSGLLGLPLSGPLQGQPLPPEASDCFLDSPGPGVRRSWRRRADSGCQGKGEWGLQGGPSAGVRSQVQPWKGGEGFRGAAPGRELPPTSVWGAGATPLERKGCVCGGGDVVEPLSPQRAAVARAAPCCPTSFHT